jgi:predicted secreted hydrolase
MKRPQARMTLLAVIGYALVFLALGCGGFLPVQPRVFQFPQDHGAHPEFRSEWWYYSGHLRSAAGDTYGYQLTFFRVASRAEEPSDHNAAGGFHSVYFAHLAVSDPARGRFHFREQRGMVALHHSGADTGRLNVWVGPWQAEQVGNGHHLTAQKDGLGVNLTLVPLKPPVLHGQQGLSRRSAVFPAASNYYSVTRMQTRGYITVGGRIIDVQGSSWMDHEFFNKYVAPDTIGWDWFAAQLDDGSELVLGMLRLQDGSLSPASAGTLVDSQGQAHNLGLADFQVRPRGTWKSPHTKAVYPSGWEISLPGAGLRLQLTPTLNDQEIRAHGPPRIKYWEGRVTVRGSKGGQPVTGQGFVELTGYAHPMTTRF